MRVNPRGELPWLESYVISVFSFGNSTRNLQNF